MKHNMNIGYEHNFIVIHDFECLEIKLYFNVPLHT